MSSGIVNEGQEGLEAKKAIAEDDQSSSLPMYSTNMLLGIFQPRSVHNYSISL